MINYGGMPLEYGHDGMLLAYGNSAPPPETAGATIHEVVAGVVSGLGYEVYPAVWRGDAEGEGVVLADVGGRTTHAASMHPRRLSGELRVEARSPNWKRSDNMYRAIVAALRGRGGIIRMEAPVDIYEDEIDFYRKSFVVEMRTAT